MQNAEDFSFYLVIGIIKHQYNKNNYFMKQYMPGIDLSVLHLSSYLVIISAL
jgi:hypothetical protein